MAFTAGVPPPSGGIDHWMRGTGLAAPGHGLAAAPAWRILNGEPYSPVDVPLAA